MSSSAPKLAPDARGGSSPFHYAEAQPEGEYSGGVTAEKAAEERLRQRENAAFERGRRETEQQLRAETDAASARSREQVSQAISEFARERTAYYLRVEREVVELALGIARKILHREVQLDPDTLAGIVRVALEKLDARTTVELHVPPQEATDWRRYFACQPEGVLLPNVQEDLALAAGECRIETSLGTTDVGIEAQLKEIETGLLDLLAQRPGADTAAAEPASCRSAFAPERRS